MRHALLPIALALLTVAPLSVLRPAAPPSRPVTQQEIDELREAMKQFQGHVFAGRFAEAGQLTRKEARLCARGVGRNHWYTVKLGWDAGKWERMAKLPAEKRVALGKLCEANSAALASFRAGEYAEAERKFRRVLAEQRELLGEKYFELAETTNNLAQCLYFQEKSADAVPLYEKAVAISRAALGEDHPDTAAYRANLALALIDLGKLADAEAQSEKALAARQKLLGEDDPETAGSYDGLATLLRARGKEAEAMPLFEKALAIRQKSLGPDNAQTGDSYSHLASCLHAQGFARRALEMGREVVRISALARGENHPDTLDAYSNLAVYLQEMGRYAEALPVLDRVLKARRKSLGEKHADTADSYINLGFCLRRQGKPELGLPLLEKAVAIRRQLFGADDVRVAAGYDGLAECLKASGDPAAARPYFEKALAIRRKARGDDHLETAFSYGNLAACLDALGKPAESLPLHEKSRAIFAKRLGEAHPWTANSAEGVANCLRRQGKYVEAERLFRSALTAVSKELGEEHPHCANCYNGVALCLWQRGEFGAAARLWQASLPAQQVAHFMTADTGFDRAQAQAGRASPHALLAVALAKLGQSGNAFAHAEAALARGLLDDLSAQDSREANELRVRLGKLSASSAEYQQARERLSALLQADSAAQVLPLARIQKSIPDDGALVLWVGGEILSEHWGCVVRRQGKPKWERIAGSGKGGAWTVEDVGVPALYESLRDPASPREARERATEAFARRRLAPLKRHLAGVKRLFVVPTGAMAYVPAEVLTSEYAVSYVPSGSMLARLREKHRAFDATPLLALGDPAFEAAKPPPAGVLVKSVTPGGYAEKGGLRAGDVLVSVGGVAVKSIDELKAAVSKLPTEASYWREGVTGKASLRGMPLGLTVDDRPAPAAVRAWRDQSAPLSAGKAPTRLPGTRSEVEAIAALTKGATVLLGSDASEQKLEELRGKGELKKFRVLHFATHGQADARLPGQSALLLARDRLSTASSVKRGERVYDGRLTVAAIRATWQLDADLVVLSACETGLGKDAEGEGLLGFAQGFLSRGARAVVLSRWQVDDTATSLLMRRFYQNLLGKRTGLKKPMGRAESLAEAKRWLRGLSPEQAQKAADELPRGKLVSAPKVTAKTYDHPYYWAAFTLIGDPD